MLLVFDIPPSLSVQPLSITLSLPLWLTHTLCALFPSSPMLFLWLMQVIQMVGHSTLVTTLHYNCAHRLCCVQGIVHMVQGAAYLDYRREVTMLAMFQQLPDVCNGSTRQCENVSVIVGVGRPLQTPVTSTAALPVASSQKKPARCMLCFNAKQQVWISTISTSQLQLQHDKWLWVRKWLQSAEHDSLPRHFSPQSPHLYGQAC